MKGRKGINTMLTTREIITQSTNILDVANKLLINKLERQLQQMEGDKITLYTRRLHEKENVLAAIQGNVLLVEDMLRFIQDAVDILRTEKNQATYQKADILLRSLLSQAIFETGSDSPLLLGEVWRAIKKRDELRMSEEEIIKVAQAEAKQKGETFNIEDIEFDSDVILPQSLVHYLMYQPVYFDVTTMDAGGGK